MLNVCNGTVRLSPGRIISLNMPFRVYAYPEPEMEKSIGTVMPSPSQTLNFRLSSQRLNDDLMLSMES